MYDWTGYPLDVEERRLFSMNPAEIRQDYISQGRKGSIIDHKRVEITLIRQSRASQKSEANKAIGELKAIIVQLKPKPHEVNICSREAMEKFPFLHPDNDLPDVYLDEHPEYQTYFDQVTLLQDAERKIKFLTGKIARLGEELEKIIVKFEKKNRKGPDYG